jgi:serine/threonine protein phosphatase PrpC
MYQISVACGCDIGRVRARNEDNIYLNGRTLEQNNRGLKGILTAKYLLDTEKCFAVFDGMGGEQAGDAAAFTAARALRAGQERLQEYVVRPSAFLKQACSEMNDAVCAGCEALPYDRMGMNNLSASSLTGKSLYLHQRVLSLLPHSSICHYKV